MTGSFLSISKVSFHYNDETPAGQCDRVLLTKKERTLKGFRAGLIFWILAPCCIPLPLLHFILVPLFLTLGTIQAWSYWTSPGILNNGQVVCPKCQTTHKFNDVADDWPIKVHCSECGYQIRIYETTKT